MQNRRFYKYYIYYIPYIIYYIIINKYDLYSSNLKLLKYKWDERKYIYLFFIISRKMYPYSDS